MAESPLYEARKRAGLTQSAAADEWCRRWPDDPRERKAWSSWETGTRDPSRSTLARLATLYRCDVAELVGAQPYTVAVAIVRRGPDVLLVRRRDDDRLDWAFPTGQVKPRKSPERVAVGETAAETGVLCNAVRRLGERRHPKTLAWTVYVLAEYLTGEPANGDPEELTAATWAPIDRLGEFIPLGDIYEPVLDHLGAVRV